MSLINDALKRAKAAQEQTPPLSVEHLPLKPVDPQVLVTHGVGLAMPVAFAVIALLLLFFAWRFYMDKGPGSATSLSAAASTGGAPATISQPDPVASATVAPTPVVTPTAPVSTSVPGALPIAGPAPQPTNALNNVNPQAPAAPLASEQPRPTTNPPTATAQAEQAGPPAPPLPPLILQGVVYSRARPSAVISGKTVFIGDRVRNFRVVAITQDTATVVGNGETNVLTLPD